jgi:hypothetical protein
MKKNGNRKAKTQKKRMLFTTFFKAQKKAVNLTANRS